MHRITAVVALVLVASTTFAQGQRRPPAAPNFDAFYELGPDSLVRRGVPKGTIKGPVTLPSQVYPGVAHDYWVYVPAQYDGKTDVSLMVFNDGMTYLQADGYYRAANVLDNLIYRGELPVMIAAFIDPGKFIKDGSSNRQAEYDPPDARYSHVIVDELLPKLYAEYRITRDPDRHAIAGWSSGAIAAFTVAWERPDQFHKVLSGIGTYVNLAGGHVYPEKVMASERKPIRIFMIDGRNDNRGTSTPLGAGVNAGGQYDQTRDWFYQNVRLKDALVAKGYDVNYAWGMGVHSHDMGGAMLPEMMRWLWRDHPVSVDPNDTNERSFRTGKSAEPAAAQPPGPNPGR
jgi:enterochelin esterase family protein